MLGKSRALVDYKTQPYLLAIYTLQTYLNSCVFTVLHHCDLVLGHLHFMFRISMFVLADFEHV